jgi:predicted dehydrogenase
MNRRHFLAQSAVTASVLGFPAITRSQSPNSLLQVASIGVARMGGSTMRSVASHPKVKIVALCDVDAAHLREAATGQGSARAGGIGFPDASQHRDWRDLLASHADKFDAVTIGTPDHMHAPMAVTALRAGKHVYLQKPMAPTIHECRVIAAEAAKAGKVTQLGNQGRSTIEGRMMVELLRSHAVGKIKEVIFWENKKLNWWPKNTVLRPQGDPIPTGLDWDLWLGTRDPRPYLADTYHPQNWRAWFDFGVGEMGDMGCHHFDSTFDGLQLSSPVSVKQTTPGSSGPLWADKRRVEMHFAGTAHTAGDTLKLTWLDGGIDPDPAVIQMPAAFKKLPPSGGFWIGERGTIFKPYGARPYLLPEKDFPASQYPSGFAKQDHYHDWVDAILAGRPSCADFAHGAALTETVLIGTLADRFPQQTLEWDNAAMKVKNLPAADALIQRAYRDGWQVPGLG